MEKFRKHFESKNDYKVGDYVMFMYKRMELGGTIKEIIKDGVSTKYKIDFDEKIDPYLAKRFTKGREPIISSTNVVLYNTYNGQ